MKRKMTKVLQLFWLPLLLKDQLKKEFIGKKGSMLKIIGQSARLNMSKLINGPVHLELFVKVVPNWRKKIKVN